MRPEGSWPPSARAAAACCCGRAVVAALGRDSDEAAVQKAAAAADGSVAHAIALLGGPLLAVRERVIELLALLPETDRRAMHALAESLERADRLVLATFVDVVRDWLSARLAGELREGGRLVRLAQAWENVDCTAREVEMFNLERKPLVFKVFGWLAEAARG
jgi:DNA polymerase III subunit delta'